MEAENNSGIAFKIVVVGDGMCGKTAMIEVFTTKQFPTESSPTVFDAYPTEVEVNNENLPVKIWDTSGSEEYENLRILIYPETNLFLVCFDTAQRSFENVKHVWMDDLDRRAPGVPRILVGLKTDRKKAVPTKDYMEIVNNHKDVLKYLECSARTDLGSVDYVFEEAVRMCLKRLFAPIYGNEDPRGGLCSVFCGSDSGVFQEKLFTSEDMIINVINGAKISDNSLLERLQQGEGQGLENYKKSTLLQKCLTQGMHKSSMFLIKSDQDSDTKTELWSLHGHSILFQLANEEIIMEVLKTYSTEACKLMSQNSLGENLLHYFMRIRFTEPIKYLFSTLDASVLEALCLHQDLAGNVQLMASMGPTSEDASKLIWNCFENKNLNNKAHRKTSTIEGDAHRYNDNMSFILRTKNKKGNNIVQLCAQNKADTLLMEICTSPQIPKETLQTELTKKTKQGRTALDLCQNEDSLISIFAIIDVLQIDMHRKDEKGKTLLHHMAQKNFLRIINNLSTKFSDDKFKDLIFQTSNNQSNVMMTAAIYGCEGTLKFFLYLVSIKTCYTDVIDKILHDKNMYGNTLLYLILQHKESLQFPKTVLLEMEKKFHSENNSDIKEITKCFNEYLDSSVDVLNALKDVEKTLKKSSGQIYWIRFCTFLTSFMVPVGLIALDVFTDGKLVHEYFGMSDTDLQIEWQNCNSTMTNASSPTPAFTCYPMKLELTPRILYSLGFMIWPWLYYVVEFWHSRMYRDMSRVGTHERLLFPFSSA